MSTEGFIAPVDLAAVGFTVGFGVAFGGLDGGAGVAGRRKRRRR
jgi:hypothetical protein